MKTIKSFQRLSPGYLSTNGGRQLEDVQADVQQRLQNNNKYSFIKNLPKYLHVVLITDVFELSKRISSSTTLLRFEYRSTTLLQNFSTSCVSSWSALAIRLSRFPIL